MFEIKLNVSKITVVTGSGTDKIIFYTDLPDGCYPYTGIQTFGCQTAAKDGAYYVWKHFNRKPDEIINM